MNVKYYLIKLPDYVKDDNIQYLEADLEKRRDMMKQLEAVEPVEPVEPKD